MVFSTKMIEKIETFFRKNKKKFKKKLEKSPTYIKFTKLRHEMAEWLRLKLLAFFSLISPVWTFLCTATLDPGQQAGTKAFSQVMKSFIPLSG